MGGKLPLGIFESIIEGTDAQGPQAGGEGGVFKFVPVEYMVETGEAEMIGVDFVAKGGWGNAAAVEAGTVEAGKPGPSSQGTQGVAAGGDTVVGEPETGAAKDKKAEETSAPAVADFAGTQNDERTFGVTLNHERYIAKKTL